MTKTILVFVILILFVAIAAWLILQKTKDVNEVLETSTPAATSVPTTPMSESKPVRYDSGLVVQDVVVGGGKAAANGDTLSVDYVGTLEDGTKFDSSYDRGQPIQFVLGAGQLIKGWELGLIGMKEGGKRKLIIPPMLGYGSKGAGGVIPPNATLLFEIELVGVVKK